MRCAGPAYQRTNTYHVHRSVLNSCCWIPAGVWERVINMFVTARLIHCDTNSWKERSVGREPLCGISHQSAHSAVPGVGCEFEPDSWCYPVGIQTSPFRDDICYATDMSWIIFHSPVEVAYLLSSVLVLYPGHGRTVYHSARNSLLLCNLIPGEGLG